MKKQKSWLNPNNQWIVVIGILAALLTILMSLPQLSSMFGQKTEPKSPILSPNGSVTVKLKIRVTDTERLPLRDVNVTVISDKTDPKLTDDKGSVDFAISDQSTQVSITFVKEGYEIKRENNIELDPTQVKEYFLKKKK